MARRGGDGDSDGDGAAFLAFGARATVATMRHTGVRPLLLYGAARDRLEASLFGESGAPPSWALRRTSLRTAAWRVAARLRGAAAACAVCIPVRLGVRGYAVAPCEATW